MTIEAAGLFVTILLAVLGTTWKLGSMLAGIQHSLEDMSRRVDKLEPLAGLAFRVERIEIELNQLHSELRRTRISPYPPSTKTLPGPQ